MTELVTELYGGEPYEYYPLGEYIVRAPGVCGGRPTFKYTRIEPVRIVSLVAIGKGINELVAGYQQLFSREALLEAIRLIVSSDPQLAPLATGRFNTLKELAASYEGQPSPTELGESLYRAKTVFEESLSSLVAA